MPLFAPGRITQETLEQLARSKDDAVVLPRSNSQSEVLLEPAVALIGQRCPRREKSEQKDGIALAAAPDHLFDQDKWSEFVSGLGSREKALHKISEPDPEFLILIRRQAADQETVEGARAREEEKLYRLGEVLIGGFRTRLTSGEYIATGLQSPSIERVAIPAELHRDMIFDFENNKGKGGGYLFAHVRLKAADIANQEPDVASRIASWLVERRARQGEEVKKVLSQAALGEFGDAFAVRDFNAAYRRVYGRKRGRPRNPRAE